MNKTEAKVPREGGWQEIDIYLFSNGQQYSPPRKYHLKADELNRWDSTMKHLAKTQYGSLHQVIELYTLGGAKIDGPLELMDGTPYVAVTPPDAFIDSGYEKYMLKASRSWEKRQTKRQSTPDEKIQDYAKTSVPKDSKDVITQPENGADQNKTLADPVPIDTSCENAYINQNVIELTTIKTPDDSFTVESMLVKPGKKTSKLKPDPQQPRRSMISTSARSEKRRSTLQHTAFMKTPNSLEHSKSNSISKNRETLHRKALTKIPVNINVPKNEVKTDRMTKIQCKNESARIQTPPSVISPIPSTLATLPPIPQSDENTDRDNNKRLATEDLSIPDVIVDKEIIVVSTASHLYQNPDSEIKSTMLETYHLPMVDVITSCNVTGMHEEAQTQLERATEETNTSNKDLSINCSKIKVFPATFHEPANYIANNFPLDDNYIAVINKGNAINMNLHLELKNGEINCQRVNQISQYTDIHKASSLTDLLKKKSESFNTEIIEQTKSLQSVITGINDTFAKVVIVQCGCCGNNVAVPRIDTMPIYKDDNGFFILMPSSTQPENTRCPCAENDDATLCDKKTKTELFIQDLCRPMPDTPYPCVTRQVGMVMTIIDSTGSQTEKYSNNKCELCMRPKQIVCINEEKCTVENCGTPCDTFSPMEWKLEKDRCSTPRSNPQNLTASTVDSCTQTEWCKVLLEVKRHEDGRYSFHLPPLSVLKKCSC